MKTILSGMLLLLALAAGAQPRYVETTAQSGEGAMAMLRRFAAMSKCNIGRFYALNQLKPNQGLVSGRRYALPIQVFAYNGVSIRTTVGITDRAQAERIQAYNERVFSVGLQEKDYRKGGQLWVPYCLLHCPGEIPEGPVMAASTGGPASAPVVPAKPTVLNEPLFGPKYQQVRIANRALEDAVFYLVSGHGGPDPGAMATRGGASLCEDEYAYDVTLRLARLLMSRGATVYVIVRDPNDGIRDLEILPHDKDERCWGDLEIPLSQLDRLQQRADVVNRLFLDHQRLGAGYQRLIEIHVDTDKKEEQVDMYFYYRNGDPLSQAFATTLHQTIRNKYEAIRKGRGYNGKMSSRELHVIRNTLPPIAFMELGNIRNARDQQRIILPANRQLVAEWLLEGMIADRKKNP